MSDQHDPGLSPFPQTQEAFDLLRNSGSTELADSLNKMATQVREVAPDCVALSLCVGKGDLTFTLVTDRPGSALLDAMQYLDGGPCVEAVLEEKLRATSALPTDEGRWQLFAQAEAALGIRSTLSMPVMEAGTAIGGVNLYASSTDAFAGHHDELAAICGAWAAGAVTNADLGFRSRVRAAATPDRLYEQQHVEVAAGIVAEHQGLGVESGEDRIREAARRAGVSAGEFARFILDAHGQDLELDADGDLETGLWDPRTIGQDGESDD